MDAHVCSMIAVWVQPAALSAVFRTQTAIMGRTAKGRRPYSVGARLPASSDGAKITKSATPACTLGFKLHADVSQTAIMTAATAGRGHWEHRRPHPAWKGLPASGRTGSLLTP